MSAKPYDVRTLRMVGRRLDALLGRWLICIGDHGQQTPYARGISHAALEVADLIENDLAEEIKRAKRKAKR
jgi:hypothetical protein